MQTNHLLHESRIRKPLFSSSAAPLPCRRSDSGSDCLRVTFSATSFRLFPKVPFTIVGMLPVPSIVYVIFLLLYSVAGLATGAACGWLVSLGLKGHRSKIWQDSLLGFLGFMGGFIGTIYMPWHENTVTERLTGGGTVTTTMSSYQHPLQIAVVLAVLLPILYELYRFRLERK